MDNLNDSGSGNIESEWIEEAMAQLQDSDTWYNYLVSAHEFTLNEDGGEGLPVPEINDIEISLGEPQEDHKFSGTISWTAADVEEEKLETLEEQLEWFIGDRLSHYQICDEEEGWHCFTMPGELRTE